MQETIHRALLSSQSRTLPYLLRFATQAGGRKPQVKRSPYGIDEEEEEGPEAHYCLMYKVRT